MRLVLLALLVVTAAGLRPKRTLGIIFRGLIDAQTKQAQPKKESAKVEKLKSPPPPAKIYLIPVPERDKKSQVQLFNTQAQYLYTNTTRPLPSSTENFVTPAPVAAPLKNNTVTEPKQFLIRILNEEGKSFMLKITGDDVQVKKKGNGYMIGVSHNEAKANINIELADKISMSKNELTQSTANLVDKTTPLFTGYSPSPEKYQRLEKGVTTPEKPSPTPSPPFPAYPFPVFLAPQFFHPQPLSYDGQFHPQQVTQYPSTIEKPTDSQKQNVMPTKQPEFTTDDKNTTSEVTKPARFQVTVRVKGEPVMKETVAEMRTTTTERPGTQSTGYHYHYPPVDPRYQYPAPEPRYPYEHPYFEPNPPRFQQPYPDHNSQRFQQTYSEPQPPRYQWYLQPPAPPHTSQNGGQQNDQPRGDYQQNNWNFAHFTPYPSYLQDTLSPPYLPTGYGRSAGQAK